MFGINNPYVIISSLVFFFTPGFGKHQSFFTINCLCEINFNCLTDMLFIKLNINVIEIELIFPAIFNTNTYLKRINFLT
jgi:hypothetical protein